MLFQTKEKKLELSLTKSVNLGKFYFVLYRCD